MSEGELPQPADSATIAHTPRIHVPRIMPFPAARTAFGALDQV
jgi:hypothetical protein